jgi:hypothetical protein
MADTATADPKEERRLQQCAQKWIAEIGVSEKSQKRWLDRAKKINRRYRDDLRMEDGRRRFAMLWSNTETIKPAIYARPPQAVVTRRFDQADPVARAASEVMERSLATSMDLQDFDGRIRECRDDFALIGRGQTWERYVPTKGPQVTPEIELQVIGEGDGDDYGYTDPDGTNYKGDDERVQHREDGTAFLAGEPYNPIVYEESLTDYVNWEDFGHSVARTWAEVWYVWRRVYLTREELIERFGTIGKVVPLDWGPIQQSTGREIETNLQKKAAVYEIWDKSAKKVYWISKSWSSRPLDERDDPLSLAGFFPCPRPLLATTANDSVIPVPDYVYYQDQAEEIDKITGRIAELQDAVKVRGFYAGEGKTNLNNLFNAPNNTLIPVPEWLRLKEGGGAKGMVEYWPIDLVVAALDALIGQRQQLMNDVYQITGIGDILRGMNDPRATATAERIKGAWGTLRIRDKQKEIIRFCRDALRIKAEVIAEHFSQETLKAISGLQLPTQEEKAQAQAMYDQGAQQYQMAVQQAQATQQPPPPQPEVPPEIDKALNSPTWEEVVGLMRDNAARNFRIDIETDSTIEPDELEERAAANEFLGAIGGLISQAGAAVSAQPLLAPLMGEMIKWGARKYRVGRELEPIIDKVIDQIAAQPPPQPEAAAPPDKTPVEVQQGRIAQEEIKQRAETERAQMETQVEMRGQDIDAQATHLKLVASQSDPEPQVSF